jgi:hypothetical protein
VIAERINTGQGFTYEQYGSVYRAWKEPLYITLLAWLTHWAGERGTVILLLQGLFGIGTAIGLAWIAYHLLGDSVQATLAGMIAGANPFLLYYDTQLIHPLSLNALLFVATTGAILLAVRDGPGPHSGVTPLRRVLAAGLMMGVALWQHATLLFGGVVAWAVAIVAGRDRRRRLVHGAICLGVAVLVVSPWLIRNYRLFDRLVITTDAAHVLWLGNNPLSNGTYSDMQGERVFTLADPAFQDRIRGAAELEQHDIFLNEVRRFIREHPDRFGALVLRRLWAFVWFSPNAGVSYTVQQQRLYRLAYAGLLLFGLVGFGLFWKRAGPEGHRQAVVLLAAVAGVASVHAITAINLKHRLPLELVLSVFAAVTLVRGFAVVRAAAPMRRGRADG